jgi:hypothetical protein
MKSMFSRREILASAAAMGAALSWSTFGSRRDRGRAEAATLADKKYLFVVTAFGGASIIDSFLAIPASTSANASTLTTFADSLVETVGNLRCVKMLEDEARMSPQRPPVRYAQKTFLQRHGQDVAVVTLESSSVSHPTAQTRAMNGGGSIDRGRTILETVADTHGADLPLPIVNMTSRGYAIAGSDPGLPAALRQVAVAEPRAFALGTHSSRGVPRPIADDLVARARLARDGAAAVSSFSADQGATHTLRRWSQLQQRAEVVEASDLVSKLLLTNVPGVPRSPDLDLIKTFLPSVDYDVLQAEAALAFLLAKNGASSSVAFGSLSMATRELVNGVVTPSVYPNEGFDFAHTSHRVAQSSCWSRYLQVTDGLISMLKTTEDPRRPGTSMWSHSLVFITTDFGRGKQRPRDSLTFGTGHDLNNGCVIVSPLVKGGRVYGGVDPNTGLTYGFDRVTGEPRPGTLMTESEIYSAVAQLMGVTFPGRIDMPALLRA